ncbi:alcohol dehydrogenase [Parafrankia irregularis]|uniref:Alcohol dehydrogenase n=1 Tax=Parafrankia irregularis TaxID=795642 RepID=A0A0S4QR35_9ACTN|nr:MULTISPECIES: alcohol dehydrogenase catalytic domain-containing protein [Parafrankia]MBE3199909.1 alcohol dehydrogenase catalytic domain-containing protein [Parafrankia sp. CH37]CUU58064.1 alcohol dehydrogenase [Parafrankia irregularis]
MRAAVLRDAGRLEVEDLDVPEPGPGEVRVQVRATGVCHTDLTVVEGKMPVPRPVVLGHEGAGVVDAVGPGVADLSVGDHVVLTITPGCGVCRQCQLGALGLCEVAAPHMIDGRLSHGQQRLTKGAERINHFALQSSFAEYAVVDRRAAVKVPDDVPFDIACLTACGVSTGFGAAVVRAGVEAGETVLVIGAGGVGLATVLGAVTAGAGRVIVADRSAAACQLAEDLGATDSIVVEEDTNLVSRVRALTRGGGGVGSGGGGGVDVAIDAVGTGRTAAAAFNALRRGGRAVVVGVADPRATVSVPLYHLIDQRVLTGSTNGSIRPQVDIPRILDLYRAGRLPLDRLVTRRYPLEDIGQAMAELGVKPGRAVITF